MSTAEPSKRRGQSTHEDDKAHPILRQMFGNDFLEKPRSLTGKDWNQARQNLSVKHSKKQHEKKIKEEKFILLQEESEYIQSRVLSVEKELADAKAYIEEQRQKEAEKEASKENVVDIGASLNTNKAAEQAKARQEKTLSQKATKAEVDMSNFLNGIGVDPDVRTLVANILGIDALLQEEEARQSRRTLPVLSKELSARLYGSGICLCVKVSYFPKDSGDGADALSGASNRHNATLRVQLTTSVHQVKSSAMIYYGLDEQGQSGGKEPLLEDLYLIDEVSGEKLDDNSTLYEAFGHRLQAPESYLEGDAWEPWALLELHWKKSNRRSRSNTLSLDQEVEDRTIPNAEATKPVAAATDTIGRTELESAQLAFGDEALPSNLDEAEHADKAKSVVSGVEAQHAEIDEEDLDIYVEEYLDDPSRMADLKHRWKYRRFQERPFTKLERVALSRVFDNNVLDNTSKVARQYNYIAFWTIVIMVIFASSSVRRPPHEAYDMTAMLRNEIYRQFPSQSTTVRWDTGVTTDAPVDATLSTGPFKTFDNLVNMEDVFKWIYFLSYTLFPLNTYPSDTASMGLYRGQDSYYSDLNNRFFVQNYNRIVGGVRFRQLRVPSNGCTLNTSFDSFRGTCYTPYSSVPLPDYAGFSSSSYAPAGCSSDSTCSPVISAFSYQAVTSMAFGSTGHGYIDYAVPFDAGGGFIFDVDVGSHGSGNSQETFSAALRTNIRNLKQHGWIDASTRAISIEFGVFNSFFDFHTAVECIVTISPAGNVSTYFKNRSMLVNIFSGQWLPLLGLILYILQWVSLIAGWVVLIREVYAKTARKCSCGNLIRGIIHPWRVLLFFGLLLLSVASVMMLIYGLHPDILLYDPARTSFKDYKGLSHLFNRSFDLEGMGLGLVALYMFRFLRHLPQLSIFRTLELGVHELLGFVSVVVITLLSYSLWAYVSFGADIDRFSSFEQSVVTLTEHMLGEYLFDRMREVQVYTAIIFFISYVALVYLAFSNVLIAILGFAYRKAKFERKERHDQAGVVDQELGYSSSSMAVLGRKMLRWGTGLARSFRVHKLMKDTIDEVKT